MKFGGAYHAMGHEDDVAHAFLGTEEQYPFCQVEHCGLPFWLRLFTVAWEFGG